MRRRSTLGSGTLGTLAPAPIRLSELHELPSATNVTSRPSKPTFGPRQLNFANTSQAELNKPRQSSAFGGQPRDSRASFFKKVPNDVSVLDGISELSQTTTELSGNTGDAVQVPKQKCSAVPAPKNQNLNKFVVNKSKVKENQVSMSQKQTEMAPGKPANKASNPIAVGAKDSSTVKSALSESKIPKPQIHSSSKASTATQLDSTVAFEAEEIAALTSTPHPDRISKQAVAKSAVLAQQMELLISDQRNLMQVMKLSFEKMNLVMDQMSLFMGKINTVVEAQAELKLQEKNSGPSGALTCSTSNVADNSPKRCKILESTGESTSVKKELTPTRSNDKENVDVGHAQLKPLAVFTDMKSKLNCLKTPTALQTKPVPCQTPNTILSNTIHSQLENLFDISETEEV